MTEVAIVVGARPNFVKAASLVRAARLAGVDYSLVHTGQHFDERMSRVFFDELRLPRPDVDLGVGSGSHAAQTARIMLAFERELRGLDPQIVVVVGDVNSTLACALVAKKCGVRVAHVEAGLRCGDEWMAEEINRVLCDRLSTYLFTTSADADENLASEGIPRERIALVGNTMIDSLLRFRELPAVRAAPSRLGVPAGAYALLTLHRSENVDDGAVLARLLEAVVLVSRAVPVVFPMHPRTARRIAATGWGDVLASSSAIRVCPPLGYLEFVGLLSAAQVVLTDSGGVQEETTALGVPCLTLRESTERPVTVALGTNRVVGTGVDRIVGAALDVLEQPPRPSRVPPLWDGRAGERIVEHLRAELAPRPAAAGASR